MNALLQTLRNLGPGRLIALGGVALALVGLLMFVVNRISAPDMALLYADLDGSDSSQIVAKLEALGVPYELRGDGAQIMVPRDRALRLRMSMAQEGLPSGGSIGYEIFDRADSLGTTNFVQRVNHLRALEGELARTIRSIGEISGARVHLVMPERALFARDQPQPTASIIITTKRGAGLDPAQVQAIQHLVAAAVPGLKPSAISIVDNWGTLLARGGDGTETADGSGATGDDKRLEYERRLARSVEELLQRSLGYGSARVEVSADMDFDRITTNSETFDPDGQVVRSTSTREESSQSGDGKGSEAVSVTNNLPDPNAAAAAPASPSDVRSETQEVTNYEISKKVETHVREAGLVKRLSVAVLIDGTYETAADGTTSYKPRSADEMKQIEKLVRSASGFDESRGDTVEVVNMRFAQATDTAEPESQGVFMGLEKADLMRLGEVGVLALLGILALLFVGRPLVTRLLSAVPAAAGQRMIAGPAAQQGLLPGGAAAPEGGDDAESAIDQMIDVSQVEGRVRASSIKKMAEIVTNHPEEAVNIMRTWMYSEER